MASYMCHNNFWLIYCEKNRHYAHVITSGKWEVIIGIAVTWNENMNNNKSICVDGEGLK